MIQFADEALIQVQSGKGGNGCIAFRREKYIPMGGPSGGDGGKGGDVFFCVKRNMRTLASLRYRQVFKAQNGGDGQGRNRYGKDGDDVVIAVPPGTTIRDADTGELIREFTTESEDEQFKFLEGGNGGWGNVHFKSSTNQAPRYAHQGKPGETRQIRVELSIMADIGLVGFPNAGKSSLLDAFTNARPKIAPYPFTTKIPNLGVLCADADRDIIIADIPGIIEGASEGAGLGIRFLKHISRTAGLLFMIDCSDENYATAYKTLCNELSEYSKELAGKSHIVLCNKIDVDGARERADEVAEAIHRSEPDTLVLAVSVAERWGLDEVRRAIIDLVNTMEQKAGTYSAGGERISDGSFLTTKKQADSFNPDFLKTRSVDDDADFQSPGDER
jgi:GTPase